LIISIGFSRRLFFLPDFSDRANDEKGEENHENNGYPVGGIP